MLKCVFYCVYALLSGFVFDLCGVEMKNEQFETYRTYSSIHVSVDFYYFICDPVSLNPARWPSELANISDDIRFIAMSENGDDLYSVCPVLHGLSSYAFDRFVNFCSSLWCDHVSCDTIYDIFGLFELVISKLGRDLSAMTVLQKLELVRERFKSKASTRLCREDRDLFRDLADLVYRAYPGMYD